MDPEPLLDAGRLAQKELELVAKGYTTEQAQMAVRRAARYARQLAEKTPADVRERVYESILDDQLLSSEAWLDGLARSARSGKYARSVQKAADEGAWKEGIEESLAPDSISSEVASRQAEGTLAAVPDWERKMTGGAPDASSSG